MPMGMKVQHSGHMSAMRLKFPFSMFQRLNRHRSHGPIFLYISVIDPGKQTEIVRVPDMGPQETTEAIVAAKEAYKTWSKVPARV